ncbi:MAG: NUDIX hydrolase [Defluviimonas sp.]|uniref:NUDIX hydrolase n=1 Tax=Albidovulum sp. TaxID=1872424 RepID=UPI001E156AF4|nr:NUDIX hydrolase [Paracoccaceae bacterium]MCC0063572.1 NUDIX hydrolase [Defluviimonas sp.]
MSDTASGARAPDAIRDAIRDAATVILLRRDGDEPRVLMGQRGAGAAFMPSKYVFPGGAVDPEDALVPFGSELVPLCARRLGAAASALAASAIRELWEETGLVLGTAGSWPGPAPAAWQGFADLNLLPAAAPLRFVFRAITPQGRPRRFDARFFLADAAAIAGDLDDFSGASDELGHLHWVPLRAARELNLPFITEVVLGEVAAALATPAAEDHGIAFFDNSGPVPAFRRLA